MLMLFFIVQHYQRLGVLTKIFMKPMFFGTHHVIQAVPQGTRLIHVSSPSIYFNFKHQYQIKEQTPLPAKAANHYIRSKREAEQLIHRAYLEHGLDVISIRPRGIFGPYDRAIFPRIMNLCKKGCMPLIGPGTQQINMTYVDNVAHSLIQAAHAPSFYSGKQYNISNDEPLAFIDILNMLFKYLNQTIVLKDILIIL